MKIPGIVKKLLSTVILIAEIVMSRQIAGKLSLEILPEWHRWSERLTFGLFVVFLAVTVVLYFICVVKDKARLVFVIWGLVCLTFANTLFATPGWLQIVLAAFLIVCLIHDGLFASFSSTAMVLVVFVICALLSIVAIPAVARIQKPKLYTKLEGLWWDLFENEGKGEEAGKIPRAEIDPISDRGLPDNMITNDPFPDEDTTPICSVKATYPLTLLHVFSCGDYDPVTFTFAIWGDAGVIPGSRSPATDYYKQALENASGYSQKAVVDDRRTNQSMVLRPYYAFSCTSEGVFGFGDRFVYKGNALAAVSAQYTFDPASAYRSSASGYSSMAASEYLNVPEEFRETLEQFLEFRGVQDVPDVKYKLSKVIDIIDKEFQFSFTPPELPSGKDPVMWFMLESKVGYSKHFAAAEVFLYRTLGIPARYSFGYKIREYNDSVAEVERRDAYAFCEVYVNGAWMLPKDALLSQDPGSSETIKPDTSPDVNETDGPVILSNGYDITHLKGTVSMFGSYEGDQQLKVSRESRSETDDTVVLVIDTGVSVDYIKAYSTGEYIYPEGSFTIMSDARFVPDFEPGKSFGEYSRDAFMGSVPEGQPDPAQAFKVYNLFAPRYIYAPVMPVSPEGLSSEAPESFSMGGDRIIVPVEGSAYDEYTLFKGGEPAGANQAYTKYAIPKYTYVQDQMMYELKQFLKSKGIDPDDPDKGALIEAVRSLLSEYTYTTKIDPIPEDEDPVMWFLTKSRSGYCSHFASAGTLLLRACGIPARFVSGYLVKLPAGSVAEVTVKNAHDWTEVFDGTSWQLVEMCVGRPAEGEALPSGLRIGTVAYTLPSADPEVGPDGRRPVKAGHILTIAAICIIAAAAVMLVRKYRPDALQKASIQYNYIKKYYYINEETEHLLNKICYSREGAQPEDVAALGSKVSAARSLLVYRRKFFTWFASMIAYGFWYLQAVVRNMVSKPDDPRPLS